MKIHCFTEKECFPLLRVNVKHAHALYTNFGRPLLYTQFVRFMLSNRQEEKRNNAFLHMTNMARP